MRAFLNHKRPDGTFPTSAPIVTSNWKAGGGSPWTVPLGPGVGQVFHFGKLPVNAQVGAYCNVVKPDDGPDWRLRAQVPLMFPKLEWQP